MHPADLARWVENHRTAARREAEELSRNAPDEKQAIESGLALIGPYGSCTDGRRPIQSVPAEDREMWDRLSRLRRHYGYPA